MTPTQRFASALGAPDRRATDGQPHQGDEMTQTTERTLQEWRDLTPEELEAEAERQRTVMVLALFKEDPTSIRTLTSCQHSLRGWINPSLTRKTLQRLVIERVLLRDDTTADGLKVVRYRLAP